MSQVKLTLIADAIQSIKMEVEFLNQWLKVPSLWKALSKQYTQLWEVKPERFTSALCKIAGHSTKLESSNITGIFSVEKNRDKYLFFAHKNKDPPSYPHFYNEKEKWKKIDELDERMLQQYLSRIERATGRTTKKRRMDHLETELEIQQQQQN